MPSHFTCPRGHRWEIPLDTQPQTVQQPQVCPQCGANGSSSVDSDSPTATLTGEGEAPPRPNLPPEAAEAWPAVAGYEILARLGQGGMGVVYKARHIRLDRIVALKMIRAGSLAGPEELARFRTEAEAVAHLQHPNIVQIYEIGEQDGLPYFALEYVEGGSLDRQVAGTPLPARAAAELVETLARAMHAAHQRGVIHRDLKPANVLLSHPSPPAPHPETERGGQAAPAGSPLSAAGRGAGGEGLGVLKITDFGLAKRLDLPQHQTQSGAILGTPSYMAPEQAGGKSREVGPATDVYALGTILYDLVTARPPFKAETPLDTLLQVISEEPVPPSRLQPKVPRDLETICLKCLHKDPPRRYATAEELADDLRRFLDGQPIRARPVGLWERGVKWARRQPARAALVALSVLVVVGLVVGGFWYADHERQRAEQARRQRDEADKARKLAQQRLVASLESTAQLAMQRGAWPQALKFLDRALEAGHADPVGLRLFKVRAWCALNEVPRAHREIEALARRSNLTDRERALVLLWQGDLAVSRSMFQADRALKLIRQAVQKGLPRVEAAYARGLLAEDSRAAVQHFREALQLDPLHPRINAVLAMTLLFLGEFRLAHDQVIFASTAFPDDPTFKVLEAVLAAADGKMADAYAVLKQAQDRLKDGKQRALARVVVDLFHQLQQMEGFLSGDPTIPLWKNVWQLAPFLKILTALPRDLLREPAPTATPLLLPLPPTFARAMRDWVALVPRVLKGDFRKTPEVLARAVRVHPEGLFYHLHGMVLAIHHRWEEAVDAFHKAAETPSIVPIHRPALFLAVQSAWVTAGRGPPKRRQKWRECALADTRKLVALGELRPYYASYLAQVATGMNQLDLARWIIAEWERRFPTDLDAQRRRLEVELKAGDYRRVLQAADVILKKQPQDAQALRYRKEALDRRSRPNR
jgi:serine/threonine protein kinase/tetratricopeptide (TPR) repeat protein